MICDPAPFDESPRTNAAPNATEKGTAKAALVLFLIGAALLLGAGVVWGILAARRALFTENREYLVRTVEIRDFVGLVSEEEIRRHLGLSEQDLRKGRNLYGLDLPTMRRVFLHDHPAISDFTLERYPPDRLVVTLGERFPVARIGHKGLVVDGSGRVFALPPDREALVDTLPMLLSESFASIRAGDSLTDADRGALTVLHTLSSLRADSRKASLVGYSIEEIDLTGASYLDLSTDNNLLLHLPREALARESDIAEGLTALGSMIAAGQTSPGTTLTYCPEKTSKGKRIPAHIIRQ